MTHLANPATPTMAARSLPRPLGGLRFDWLMITVSLIFCGGLFLDGWAHNHGKVDQSFFTIWHAFFYSGYLLTALLLLGTMTLNRVRGISWRAALPAGYELSVLGVLIFAAGGVGDMIWHELFGIEKDFEALLSPSHLALGTGLSLVIAGPLRAAWRRKGQPTWANLGPALLSTAALISTLMFFMMFSHPLVNTVGGSEHRRFASDLGQMAGITGILLITALWIGPVLLLLRRWQLPAGSLTLIFTINSIAMAIVDWDHAYQLYLLLATLLAAAAAEFLLRPHKRTLTQLRRYAFFAPLLVTAAYFAALAAVEGIQWSIHLWAGAIVLSAIAGWLVSYLVFPPALPEEA